MIHYKYLIIGGGMTADAAVTGIREVDSLGKIGIISAETDRPYNRPPLTKALWKGEPLESVWRGTEKKGVEFHLGRRIATLEIPQKRAVDDQQNVYGFDKLLLATGGRPRLLPFGDERVIYYRTLEDYRRLHALTEKHN
jgi:NAD(P)H-nitrite reductase large subunit